MVDRRELIAADEAFYSELFRPIEEHYGPADPVTITGVVGFSAGGPISVFTFRTNAPPGFVTYATCELAAYPEQRTGASPRFELMITCDKQEVAHAILTGVGALSLDADLGDAHTVDVSQLVPRGTTVAGVALERFASVRIHGEEYAILRCVGLTASELDVARKRGAQKVLRQLAVAGVYPNVAAERASVV